MRPELKHPYRLLYFVCFLFSMQYGLVLYINSSFLGLFVAEKIVGLIFSAASAATILFLLLLPRILSRFGNYKTTIFIVIMNALFLILIGSEKLSYFTLIFFLLFSVTSYSLVLVLDIFIENNIEAGKIGRTRGLFLTIRNLAILSSPILAAAIVTKASYFAVYIGAGIISVLSLFFIFPHLKNFKDPIYRRISVRETFKKIKGDGNLKKIYASEFLLNFFYSWMIIYMPLYLHEYVGLAWERIGLIFTIMLIPFVLVEYPLGRLSDKVGEKGILSFGFFVMMISIIIIFFIKTQNILVWASVLFITRIGAASVEIMNESYFFKKIGASDAGLIGFFRNMFPLAFVVSPIMATLVLFLVPTFPYLFLVLALVMSCGFLISLRLKDIK